MALRKKSQAAKSGSVSQSRSQSGARREPLAIVGIGCRYPGISSPAELWQTLMDGKEVLGPYPGGRFAELDSLYEEVRRKPGRLLTDRGGFLADVAGFDSQFFEISPRESIYVDPQHRLLLEVAWEALEDAGQVRESYEGSATGVYIGLWTNEYESRLYESGTEADFYSVTGCGHSAAPARLSFAFGLQGPSLAVDTACSSSLMAVHLACQALWAGEIDMALAGGANMILGCEISERFTQAKLLSPDGRCKFGDASADGFVRGEGAGIVVLKRLSQAILDKDPIYALIRGSATNNDGRSSFLVAPSIPAQRQMMRAAWDSADIDPKDILYVEMHGTGTTIGDRVEIKAISAELAKSGVIRPCLLGSVKTNIGHTESAAGVAGLIKAALIVRHRMVAPSLNVSVPTPKIPWKSIPVRIATESVDLSAEPGPILAGVSSFGLSGTNVHVVLEEVEPAPSRSSQGVGPYFLPISAKTPEALHAMLGAHLAAMQSAGESYPIGDVCYTAGARRTHHEHRVAIIGDDLKTLASNLAAAAAEEDCDAVVSGHAERGRKKIVFVAPGQGSQWPGMARELFDRDPVFRQAFEECDAAIASETGWRLSSRLLGADAECSLSEIDVIQPALFTMSVALAAVWRAWGIEPDAVIGHSMGEVAAAHIAGILSLEDAAAVICRRSRLMKTLRSAGSMATVELPLHEVETLIAKRDGISVGASNGPDTTVISGDSGAIDALLKELEAKEIYCRQIKVDVASHSAQVDPILNDLFITLAGIRPQPAKIPMLSTVTGEYARPNGNVVMDARYWVENLRRTVLFAPAIETLSASGHDTFVELSPHPVLLPSMEASARMVNPRAIAIASLRREKPECATLLHGLASLYVSGCRIAWQKLYPEDAHCVALPQYQFQRKRYWPEPVDPAGKQRARQSGSADPLLGRRFQSSLQPDILLWESQLDTAALPYLDEHRVLGSVVVPVSGHLAMVLAAAKAARPGQRFVLRDAAFLSAVYLPDEGGKVLQLALIPEGNDAFRFELRGDAGPVGNGEAAGEENRQRGWTLHTAGVLAGIEQEPIAAPLMAIEELKRRYPVHLSREEHYEKITKSGLSYGPAFQLIEEAWVSERESLCRVRCQVEGGEKYAIHPALLDACFQAMVHVRPEEAAFKSEDMYLPVAIESVRIHGAIPDAGDLYASATLTGSDAVKGTLRVDLRIADADGSVLADIVGMELKRLAREGLQEAMEPLYTVEWVEEELHGKAEATVALLPRVSAESWVIFADGTGIADAMKVSLASVGGRCTIVRAKSGVRSGTGFRKIADAEFEIDPNEPRDFGRVLEAVANDTGVPTAVVHLWTLDNDSPEGYDADRLMDSQAIGSQCIPALVQAIAAAEWQNPPRLWLITAGVMTVIASDGLPRIENAPMWGIGRAVMREHAELRTMLVDLSVIPDVREARSLAREICACGKEDRIALRGTAKYFARLRHFSEAATGPGPRALPEDTTDRRLFLADASYLITGGLGGVALTVAEWMAANGAGHLVLLSRRAASAETDAVVRRIEDAGATVTAFRADVTHEDELVKVMETIHASGFPLKGIMHTAAVADAAPISDLSPERFLPVMAPKIAGAWNLHAATRQENLDFFVLFSSLAALYSQPGMGSYAAANAFLDSFAHYLRRRGIPGISVNWGVWDQIGLARSVGVERGIEAYVSEGFGSLSGDVALQALRRALETNPAQMVAVPIDVERLVNFCGLNEVSPLFADLLAQSRAVSGAPSKRPDILDQLNRANSAQRREILESYLQETLGRVLKLAPQKVDLERPLGSIGLDSLMGLELVRRLSSSLGIAVPATVVFNYPTIRLLAAHLLRRMQLKPIDEPVAEAADSATLNAVNGGDEAVDDLSGELSEEDALQALIGNHPRSS